MRFLIPLFFSLLLPIYWVAANSCEECRHNGKSTCSFRCDSFTEAADYDSCVADCIKSGCEKACTPKNAVLPTESIDPGRGMPGGRSAIDCNSCLKGQEASGCGGQCDKASPRYSQCTRKCAKRACASVCSLPDATEEKPIDPTAKYSCQKCQDEAEPGCRRIESCDPESPSLNACVFKCIQDRCADNCN